MFLILSVNALRNHVSNTDHMPVRNFRSVTGNPSCKNFVDIGFIDVDFVGIDFAGIVFINLDSVGTDFVSMCMKYSNISAPQFSS